MLLIDASVGRLGRRAGADTQRSRERICGLSRSRRRAGTGPFTQFKNALGDLQENIGAGLVGTLNRIGCFGLELLQKLAPLKAAFANFKNTLGGLFSNIWKVISQFLPFNKQLSGTENKVSLLTFATRGLSLATEIVSHTVSVLSNLLQPLAPVLKWVTGLAVGARVTFITWNVAMRASPLGLVITGITLLVGSISTAWKRFSTFRAVVLTAWDSLKTFWQSVKDGILGIIPKLLSGPGALGSTLKHLFAGNFSQVLGSAKEDMRDLFDALPTSILAKSVEEASDTFGEKFQLTLSFEQQKQAHQEIDRRSVEARTQRQAAPGMDSAPAAPQGPRLAMLPEPSTLAKQTGLQERSSLQVSPPDPIASPIVATAPAPASGPARPKVTIQNVTLIDQLTLSAQNVSECIDEIARQV